MATTKTIMALFTPGAGAQQFPCQSFQMQPNGMLSVIQPITISSPNGSRVSMGPGASFGPGATMAGLNLYELYKQNCR